MPELTESSLTDHTVTFHDPRQDPRTIRCAYVTGEDSLPHLLVFRDHEHRTTALVNQDLVLAVERQPRPVEQHGIPLVQLPSGMIATDGQIADLQAALDAAAYPRKVILVQNCQVTSLSQ